MTIKELRDRLDKIDHRYDHYEVTIPCPMWKSGESTGDAGKKPEDIYTGQWPRPSSGTQLRTWDRTLYII